MTLHLIPLSGCPFYKDDSVGRIEILGIGAKLGRRHFQQFSFGIFRRIDHGASDRIRASGTYRAKFIRSDERVGRDISIRSGGI